MADDHVAKRTDRGLAVQEPVLASWAATLRSVNGSRLVLKDRTLIDSSQQARILTRLPRMALPQSDKAIAGGIPGCQWSPR